jgi:hypothetical protein
MYVNVEPEKMNILEEILKKNDDLNTQYVTLDNYTEEIFPVIRKKK